MPKFVDARGRSCPEPVMMTKQAIDSFDGEEIKVVVDTRVAVENIKRYVQNQGFNVEDGEYEGDFSLLIKK